MRYRCQPTFMMSRRWDSSCPCVGIAFLAFVSFLNTFILDACIAPTTLSHPSTFACRRACC